MDGDERYAMNHFARYAMNHVIGVFGHKAHNFGFYTHEKTLILGTRVMK